MKRFVAGLTVLLISVFMASSAMATRGPSPHAFGTRETGLGGAFDAISDDAISPAAYNPAGLTQIKNKRFDMDMLFLRTYQNFTNRNNNPQNGQNGIATSGGFLPRNYLLLNNNTDARTAKNNYFIMGGMGYAMRLNSKTVFGIGFIGKAGGGVFFKPKETPFSFIRPYDSEGTVNPNDDQLVPMVNTRRTTISGSATTLRGFTDSTGTARESRKAYMVSAEYSTDLKIPEIGPAIGYKVNDYLSIGFGARIVAGQFRFKQAIGTDATIMKGTGRFSKTHELGDTASQAIKDAGLANYGGVLSGKFRDASLGGVQFGFPELQGIGRLENAYAFGFGWDGGVQYRPYGSNKLVLSASYRSRSVMDFKGGELMLDFSDQFRKFYYDTGQFAPFEDASFGAYLPGGPTKFRGPRFFNAVLSTIDNAVTEDPSPKRRALAKAAMNWFLHGKNKDGTPHVVLDGNGYVRSLNLTAYYDPYMQFALPRELTFGAAWRPTERLLLSCEYKLIYMNDMVGDYFTFNLRSGNSPFFNWLILSKDQIERGDDSFDFSMHTDFNTIRSISLGAEYDLGNKWTVRGGLQHSNNPFTAKHIPITFNMQPEDVVSGGCSYRLTENWELSFAGATSFTWDTTESKGTEKTGPNSFDPNFASNAVFHKGSEIDQFHSNAAFDHKQWQVNFGVAYLW